MFDRIEHWIYSPPTRGGSNHHPPVPSRERKGTGGDDLYFFIYSRSTVACYFWTILTG